MASQTEKEMESNSSKTVVRIRVKLPRPSKEASSDELNASTGSAEREHEERAASDDESSGSRTSSDVDDDEPQIPTCPECRKTFPSLKSLYGHLRSHPNRGYRGANKPANGLKRRARRSPLDHQNSTISHWTLRAERGRCLEWEIAVLAAKTLMSISRSSYPKTLMADEGISESTRKTLPSAAKIYQCTTCYKTFTTHQALGGHRASHNRHRNNLEAEAMEGAAENGAVQASSKGTAVRASTVEHKCKICNETFATGQALGGHMRRHYNVSSSTGSSESDQNHILEHANQAVQEIVRNENCVSIPFDLNEAPPRTEAE